MQLPVLEDEHVTQEIITQELTHAQEYADKVSKHKESITDPEIITQVISDYERYVWHATKAAHLAEAALSVDTNNQDILALHKHTQQTNSKLYKQTLFFGHTIGNQPKEVIDELRKQLPEYDNFFYQLHKHAQYQLSEEKEQLISTLQQTGANAIGRVRDLITNGYEYTIEVDGEEKTVSQGELRTYMRSEDRDVRKKAREALRKPVRKDKLVLYELYQSVVDNYRDINVGLRGYENPIDARHHANETTADTYRALRQASKQHHKLWNRFLEKKKELLGYDELYGYDIYAPLPGLAKNIPYKQAQEMVLDSFSQLGDWMVDDAKKVLESGRVDAKPRVGKYYGACCFAVASTETPIVLLNYNGDFEDVETLAHELGHAVHDLQAQKNNQLVFRPPLTLAETASNIAETLLFERMYAQASTQEKQALLDHRITALMASIPVQLRYTAFEEYAHEKIKTQAKISELDEYWKELSKQELPILKREDEEAEDLYWLAIPHFNHTPFYCYSYSFGALLSLGLYEDYTRTQDASAIQEFLQAGGSVQPTTLLKQHGYDPESTEFWNKGFARIQTLIERFESL